jgi:hypothetical protein
MTGDNQSRFCGHCQKQVHDLSSMTTDAAQRLLCESAGPLCVRFQVSAEGKPITLDYAPAPIRRRWLWPVAAIASLAAGVLGCVLVNRPKPKPVPVFVMGAIAPIQSPLPSTNPTTNTVGANEPCSLEGK